MAFTAKRKKIVRIVLISVATVLLAAAVAVVILFFPSARYREEQAVLIAHALGGFEEDGKKYVYSNTEEAFFHSYDAGIRWFEVDLVFSADGELIGVHEWENLYFGKEYNAKNRMTYAEYRDMRLAGRYTGITFPRLLELMTEYEDIYVVLDTKETDYAAFYTKIEADLLMTAAPETIRSRIVPQLYSLPMYDTVEAIASYPSYVLTLYKYGPFVPSAKKIGAYPKIDVVAMELHRMTTGYVKSLREGGLELWLHTINRSFWGSRLLRRGASALYTDMLRPTDGMYWKG